MQVYVQKLNSGGIQIAIRRLVPGVSTGPAITYGEEAAVRSVLAAFGFNSQLIDDQLNLLSEIETQQVLHFPDADIDIEILRGNGFVAI